MMEFGKPPVRFLIPLVALALGLLMVLPAAGPAQAATGASVLGSVVGIDDYPAGDWNGPLPGVRATAVNAATGAAVKGATTDALGKYRITGLPAGTYKIKFTKTGWLTAVKTGVVLSPGQSRSLGQQTVRAEAVLLGAVYSDSDPLSGARVTVFNTANGKVVAAALSDPSGTFRIGQLPAGTYKVRGTKDGYRTSWANFPAYSYGAATPYTLVAGQQLASQYPTVLYMDLAPQTSIKGSVFGLSYDSPAGGGCPGEWDDPLGGVQVIATDAPTGTALKSAVTDSAGAYQISGLTPGTYKVQFVRECWTTTWFEGEVDGSGGGTKDLGETTMYGEVVISGHVTHTWTDREGTTVEPAVGRLVTVLDAATGAELVDAVTDAEGNYRIGQVPVQDDQGRTVRVRAIDCPQGQAEGCAPDTLSDTLTVLPGYGITQDLQLDSVCWNAATCGYA